MAAGLYALHGVSRSGTIFTLVVRTIDDTLLDQGASTEVNVITSRNAEVMALAANAVEGKRLYGGDMLVKTLMRGDEMTLLELHYAAGVGAPLHAHTHESIVYVVTGKVKSTVGSSEFIMGPGDACRHPKGVLHGLGALEDAVVVEIKSPAPEPSAFLGLRERRE